MTIQSPLRLGPVRRFTRNLLCPVDILGRPLLVKYTRDPAEAREEIRGHAHLARHYRVPALHAHLRVPGGHLLAYERLPGGTDKGLLLDLLNADEPSSDLHTYMDRLTAAYREVILATAWPADPAHVIRKLYWDRAAPGGRLDTYYAGKDFLATDGLIDVPVSRLGTYTLSINGRQHHLDWAAALRWLRAHFAMAEPVWAALTQGDPTDVNLAHPLTWFDYDTAGMNSIPDEFANFLWYASTLGGWLVPTYNPTAFADHPATFDHVPANTPEIRRAPVDHTTSTIPIDYAPRLSTPRRTAVTTYWNQLVRPIADRLWPGTDLANLLRPYLAMRILAVYNMADPAPEDRLVLLARLAETMKPHLRPHYLLLPAGVAMPGPLNGRTALVTGATGGLGSAIVRRLASDGATVALAHLDEDKATAKLATHIADSGGNAVPLTADLHNAEAVRALYRQARPTTRSARSTSWSATLAPTHAGRGRKRRPPTGTTPWPLT
ncbi:SDR family NAD(P)-dependent oxidoreductase [Streptomyces sp. NBC_01363]|uniref:SDR family NAD(P)-dependent oxidoreductase n=1 Tax=Streptomyces sp. NBC_01363 TaxID=2903840 RepID=UPI00224D631D|nr:SDR family NAD(P)-dependent oxidoreductase [Streptomyces sp. NBC_01363]MCX4733891.1 SDR family NAD(P)-dependent oxidoreductase [Streptomyces sp. NBC_01363]